jgi:hypothetical protein
VIDVKILIEKVIKGCERLKRLKRMKRLTKVEKVEKVEYRVEVALGDKIR